MLCECAALNPDSEQDGAYIPSLCSVSFRQHVLHLCMSLVLCCSYQPTSYVSLSNEATSSAGDEEDGEMYYDEDEVLAGSGAEARAAMLDHFDSLLQTPHDADLDGVSSISSASCSWLYAWLHS